MSCSHYQDDRIWHFVEHRGAVLSTTSVTVRRRRRSLSRLYVRRVSFTVNGVLFQFLCLLRMNHSGLFYFSWNRDQYTSPKIIRLKELEEEKLTIEEKKKQSASDKKKLREIEDEMAPLQKFLKDAQTHRLAIKRETGAFFLWCIDSYLILDSLRTDATKAVIVLDFTKFGIVDEGNVHCFVVAVLTRGSDTDAQSGAWCHHFISFLIISCMEASNQILRLCGTEYWQASRQASVPLCEGAIVLWSDCCSSC